MCVIESSGMAGKVFRKEKNKPVGNKFDKLDLFNNSFFFFFFFLDSK